jgi:hypothetical protein
MRVGKLVTGILLAGWASAASGAERFTGRILDMSGMRPGFADLFVLHVDEVSSDAEVSRLMSVLEDKGTNGLHDALRETKQIGWIRIGGEPAPFYGIVRSRSLPDGSREIRVFTDGARVPSEKKPGPRADDRAFGWVELKLDPNGKGEGRLTAAKSVRLAGNEIEMVGFGEKPFQLRDVRAETAE